VRKRLGLKSINQISKWKRVSLIRLSLFEYQNLTLCAQLKAALLTANAKAKCMRKPGGARWPLLEKQLVKLFAERREAGRVVRRGWFERQAKRLHSELYPDSTAPFSF
jgi:hypothetical protein